MKPILIHWNIIYNHSAITKLTTNINKSHWGDVDLAIIVSPGSSTIELPYSIVPTDKWSARVSLKYADEIFLEDVVEILLAVFQLTSQVFALIPQAHSTAFLTGAECILHDLSLISESEAYKWHRELAVDAWMKQSVFGTSPFVEALIFHIALIHEILFPILWLWPAGQ